jgi:hypothetical protein
MNARDFGAAAVRPVTAPAESATVIPMARRRQTCPNTVLRGD